MSFGRLERTMFLVRHPDGTDLRRFSRRDHVVWSTGPEDPMRAFDLAELETILLTMEDEGRSLQLRSARTGRVLRSFSVGRQQAFDDSEQLALEGACERASRVAPPRITLQTYGS